MIYTKDLESIILERHKENKAEELWVLGGYIGPTPVEKIAEKEIKSKIIYGCKPRANLKLEFHNKYRAISETESSKTEVFYKSTYNHSKIYCWHDQGNVKEIIAGSANFSTNGLNNDFEEVLFDVSSDDYQEVYRYLRAAFDDSESCLHYEFQTTSSTPNTRSRVNKYDVVLSVEPPSARISFKDRSGNYSQINTGPKYLARGHNVPLDDCVITIRSSLIDEIPELFPNRGINPNFGLGHGAQGTSKQRVEFLFDDGTVMEMSFEQIGSKREGGRLFKALRSAGSNEALGKYLRNRMGLESGDWFTEENFKEYGRDYLDITLESEGVYFADFSKKSN